MRRYFAQLSPRDQLSLLVLLPVLVAYLFYMLAFRPLLVSADALQQRNAAAVQTLARVDGLVTQLNSLRIDASAPASDVSLTALINRSTAAAALSVSRLQPNSRGELQLRLENAPLDRLLRWLHSLEEEQGVLVLEAALSEAGGGRVNATLRLGSGG